MHSAGVNPVAVAYRIGWRTARVLPPRAIRALAAAGALVAVAYNGPYIRTLRHNLSMLTGTPVDDRLARRAVASHLRNVLEMLALTGWSPRSVRGRVTTVGEPVLRTAYAGQGAVVALPHSGSWDLAGAWSCLTGMPVTTVAEQLPAAEYADFVRFRERLGMEVVAHNQPDAISHLATAVRRGRLVCLLADRDLAGTGVPVVWAGRPVTMPAGPAIVARRTGAALIPAVCQFTPTGMRIRFGAPVAPQPGRAGLIAMTQQVADFFVAALRQQPEDWHMFQRFFAESHDNPEPAQ